MPADGADQPSNAAGLGFDFADALGPSRVVHLYEPALPLHAVVVIDNVAAGPAIGGLRLAPDVTTEECFRLARAMTFKSAAAGLPHGGGKAVIRGDPKMAAEAKQSLIRAFACAIRDVRDYIPGPDMGTDERAMAWINDEIGRAVGLPPEIGGIPLDEIGATGFGLAVAAEVAQEFCSVSLAGARVAVQGFGSVGQHAARYLANRGSVLVAVSDTGGCLVDADGLDVEGLVQLKRGGGGVTEHERGEKRDRDAIIDVACDIWIPAARPDVIRPDNVDRLDTKLVLQGANIAIAEAAEITLHQRGVLVVPDFIANAGGVICAAVEFASGSEAAALDAIESKIRTNTQTVLSISADSNVPPRQAAMDLANARVRTARSFGRWSSARP